jgi:hypothetical protein
LLLLALTLLPSPAAARAQQARAGIEITLPAQAFLARDAPVVSTVAPLSKKDAEKLLRNGFPARLRYVTELWPASGLVGKPASTARWEVYVDYEPLSRVYRIVRVIPDRVYESLGSFATFAEVTSVLARGYQPQIRAPIEPGRYYYSATLEVERLSANDLVELRSWLGSSVTPQKNAGKAVLGFIAQVFTALIGAEKESHQTQSAVFTVR